MNHGELQQFLGDAYPTDIAAQLQLDRPLAQLCFDFVALLNRTGLINDRLFDALASARPAKRPEIDLLRRIYLTRAPDESLDSEVVTHVTRATKARTGQKKQRSKPRVPAVLPEEESQGTQSNRPWPTRRQYAINAIPTKAQRSQVRRTYGFVEHASLRASDLNSQSTPEISFVASKGKVLLSGPLTEERLFVRIPIGTAKPIVPGDQFVLGETLFTLSEHAAAGVLLNSERADARQVHPIDRESLYIGRRRTCDVVVDDLTISRRHARILTIPSGKTTQRLLSDVSSENGTWVRVRDEYTLTHNDEFTLNGEQFRVVITWE